MIFWFSGTGNSAYAARVLKEELTTSLYPIVSTDINSVDWNDDTVGLVFPIYSWGIPPIMLKFVEKLATAQPYISQKKIWMVCTCGDETAMAPEMLEKRMRRCGLNLAAGWSVIMPNNYVILPGFNVDSKDLEQRKLDEALPRIKQIAEKIKSSQWENDYVRGSWPRLKTRLVYPLFKRWGIFPKKWHWTPECVRCGKCAAVCPVKNIKMKGEHPSWGGNCLSCLACYHICPVHAVEYGKTTRHKGQYFCKR